MAEFHSTETLNALATSSAKSGILPPKIMKNMQESPLPESALNELRDHVLLMGGEVERAIDEATRSLIERDSELAEQVLRDDDRVDALELEADQMCVRLLAMQSQAANDLRLVVTAIKITPILERIADHACNIARAGSSWLKPASTSLILMLFGSICRTCATISGGAPMWRARPPRNFISASEMPSAPMIQRRVSPQRCMSSEIPALGATPPYQSFEKNSSTRAMISSLFLIANHVGALGCWWWLMLAVAYS